MLARLKSKNSLELTPAVPASNGGTVKNSVVSTMLGMLLVPVLLSSCSNLDYTQILGKQYDDFFRLFIAKGDSGQISEALAMTVPELNTDTTKAFLDGMAKEHAGLSVASVSLLGASRTTVTLNSRTETIAVGAYEYKYPGYYVLYEVSLLDSDGVQLLRSLKASASVVRAEERYPFVLVGVPFWNYVFLLFFIGFLIFVVVSEVSLFRLAVPVKTKVLWAIVMLIGFGKIVLSWNDGQLNFNLLSLQIMFPSIAKSPTYAPWTITLSLPLGALLYWYRRKSIMKKYVKEGVAVVNTADINNRT